MSPEIPPEADVIRLAREAMDMTAQSAAEASRARDGRGVSAAYWRDVERGYGGRRGQRVPTRASARALAVMARVVGVTPDQLTGAGREDAARVLEEILRREGHPPPPIPAAEPPDTDPDAEEDDTDPPMSPAMKAAMLEHLPDIEVLVARATDLAAVEDPDHPVPRGAHLVQAGAAPNEGPRWDLLTEAGAKARWSRRKVMIFMAIGRVRDSEHRAQQQGREAGLILTRG